MTCSLLTITACTTLPPSAQQYDSFSAYAEAVFRHQNDLISRLMMLNESDELADSDDLEEAEQAMHDACHLLNEYAESESDGEITSPFFKHKVRASIEQCDQSIQRLEARLAKSRQR